MRNEGPFWGLDTAAPGGRFKALAAFARGAIAGLIIAIFGAVSLFCFDTPAHAGTAVPPHHDISITLDPAGHHLSARDRITLDGSGTVYFHLSELFVLEGVRVDGHSTAVRRDGNVIAVRSGGGGRHSIEFRYQGRLPSISPGALNGFALSARGGFLSQGWFPRLSGAPFTYAITVDTPLPNKAVAPGQMTGETIKNGHYRVSFRSEAPTDTLVVFSGPYAIASKQISTPAKVVLRTYFVPEIAKLSADYLDFAARYIQRYAKTIGPYPFSRFDIVSGPLPVGLGFSGLTYIGTDVLKLPFIRYTSLGHEVLHNWWGNAVGVDYTHGNWAEGLTTFMADYTFAQQRSAVAGRDMRLEWLRNFSALPPQRDRPAVDFIAKNHDASQVVGYDKVAFFFVMLRAQIGSKAFDRAIGLFWRNNRFKRARWNDLQKAFESASGRKLDFFFRQWLHRKGAPSFTIAKAQVRKNAKGYRVSFVLRQAKPVYRIALPVVITSHGGTHRFIVTASRAEQRVNLDVPTIPSSLEIDPDYQIFRRLSPGEATPILRDVTLDPRSETLIIGNAPGLITQGRALSARLLGPHARVQDGAPYQSSGSLPTVPLVLIGTVRSIEPFIETMAIAPLPARLARRGTAWAWATRSAGGKPVVIVSAHSAEALGKIVRALPHYRRRSYVVFDGARVIENGNWPAKAGAHKLVLAPPPER